MKHILLVFFSITFLNAIDYKVKLFDTNISKGVWQMVGTLGLRDLSVGAVTYTDEYRSDIEDPIVPDDDSGETIISNISGDSDGIYDESGVSESEIDISNIFDINLSDDNFNPLNSVDGELSIYRYNGVYFDSIWSYYNSKNNSSGNDFNEFEKGRGYWARYDNKRLEFETNSSYLSDSGFIFSNNFTMGLTTYTGKIFEGWNLLSLPEKRTVEVIYITILEYNSSRDYNLTISKKDNLNKLEIILDNNSTLEAVIDLNLALNELGIFAIESNISSINSQISFLSRTEFVISDENNISTFSIPDITNTTSENRVESSYIYGLILDINQTFISNFEELFLDLNGKNIDINSAKLESLDGAIRSFEMLGVDKNLTLIFSKNSFYLENNNYLKNYDYNSSKRPDNFLSIDNNATIFQIGKDRKDINSSLSLIPNRNNLEIIKGYGNMADIILNLSLKDNVVKFPELPQSFNYIKLYSFPKTDNLRYFLRQLFEGYIPTQVISLKNGATNSGKWDSMPINNSLTDWTSFSSQYDRTLFIDKERAYWVKFIFSSTSTAGDFLIDSNQTSISREVTHQLLEDNITITNIVHYKVQIFLKNVSKAIRGYIKVDNLEIELKPELDGTLLTAEIDYESLYNISNLESISQVTATVVDENGLEKTVSLDINFVKPTKPSSAIKLVDILSDSYYRIYQEDLSSFKVATTIYPDLCHDLGLSIVYVVRADSDDSTLSKDKLILSNSVKITYPSIYKNTSKITSSTIEDINQPIKYSDSCEKISDVLAETEGITLGVSEDQLYLYYRKASEFISETLTPPKIMYIKVNERTVRIKFDLNYEGYDFYILDSEDNIFSSQFTSDIYNNNQYPLTLNKR